MTIHKHSKQVLTMVITLSMVMSLVPAEALSEGASELRDVSSGAGQAEQAGRIADEDGAASDERENPVDGGGGLLSEPAEDEPEPGFDSNAESEPAQSLPAFEQSSECDGVTVTVKAGEGIFPEGAQLFVSAATAEEKERADAAIEERRAEDANVAASRTFDVSVRDAEGNELQPADGGTVEVSFALAQVADTNLTTDLYHLVEQDDSGNGGLEAQKLEATVNAQEQTVTAESDGFSLYTVEFTYGDLQYVLTGEASIPLATILEVVGLVGDVEDAQSSNPDLFSVVNEDGTWIVNSRQAFTSEEQLSVTIAGMTYDVRVTDATVAAIRVRKQWTGGGQHPGEVKVDYEVYAEVAEGEGAPRPPRPGP